MIQPDMELSDSEDEGEGGRRNHQSNKSTGKVTPSAKTPELDASNSGLLSADPQATRSPHTATTAISSEAIPSPTAGEGEAAENNGSAAMDVDTAK